MSDSVFLTSMSSCNQLSRLRRELWESLICSHIRQKKGYLRDLKRCNLVGLSP